jgi:drug/metabolite transporter (DMT)-like permease
LQNKSVITGIGLAVLATLIWSGNYVIARGVYKQINPVSLAFYRWATATVILFPFAIRRFSSEWSIIRRSWQYLFWVAFSGIALFNTIVYYAGHYTTAINLALIGTTTSPVISIILARIFLKERIGLMKIGGLILCLVGILFLLSKGDLRNLFTLSFSIGDAWMLVAAFCFSVYVVLVRKKPGGISPVSFLFAIFSLGTLLLLPFFLWQHGAAQVVNWNFKLTAAILYIGLGASVICYFMWNTAISILGAGRTALFGNLITVFSSLEAVILLNEQFSWIHIISMLLVFAGLLLANLRPRKIVTNKVKQVA